jgi:hypothetical protein
MRDPAGTAGAPPKRMTLLQVHNRIGTGTPGASAIAVEHRLEYRPVDARASAALKLRLRQRSSAWTPPKRHPGGGPWPLSCVSVSVSFTAVRRYSSATAAGQFAQVTDAGNRWRTAVRSSRKRVMGQPIRGFKSHLHRHVMSQDIEDTRTHVRVRGVCFCAGCRVWVRAGGGWAGSCGRGRGSGRAARWAWPPSSRSAGSSSPGNPEPAGTCSPCPKTRSLRWRQPPRSRRDQVPGAVKAIRPASRPTRTGKFAILSRQA